MTQTQKTAPTLAAGDPDAHPVKITMRGVGRGAEILVHGVDVAPDVHGFHLSAPSPTELPDLVLVLTPRLSTATEWEGFARVLVGEQPDPGPAAAVFLDAIDAEALEQAALSRPDLGADKGDLTRAMLAQLIEWAQGR